MPSIITELSGVRDLATLTGMNITNIRDAKTIWSGETGIDVVFDFDGQQFGAQHTVFHADEAQVPGKRGSPARATEEAIAQSTQRPFGMFVHADYRPALVFRVKEKIALANRYNYQGMVEEMWLVISAQLPKWGAVASTGMMPGAVQAADLNGLLHVDLAASKFSRVYLVSHLGRVVHGWNRECGWSVRADPDAGERKAHRERMSSLMSMISPRWR